MAQHMLTTVDNPFDPVTEYEAWDAYDQHLGYHTMSLLARIIVTSDDLGEPDQEQAMEDAVQEVWRENVSGMHRLVPIPS